MRGSRPPPGRSAARTDTALAAHESQKTWLDQTQGMDSYVQTMENLCREVGKMSGRFEFAEGWRKHLHAGFCRRTRTRCGRRWAGMAFRNRIDPV